MTTYAGRCHCGAIGFEFHTDKPPSAWAVRACQCGFCRAHAAACTSDPSGHVVLAFTDESALQRYRFGMRTADFLLCRNCGVYLGAVLETAAGRFATLNTHAMASVRDSVPTAEPVEYGGESAESRRLRRQRTWTPVIPDEEIRNAPFPTVRLAD